MPSNVEVKAHIHRPEELAKALELLQCTGPFLIEQRDTFFVCPTGRLKLREFGTNQESPTLGGELIWYSRSDVTGSKLSEFKRVCVEYEDAPYLREVLSTAYGVVGSVKKTRNLYFHESTHTRIHIDEVEGLGRFIELEVVLQPGQAEEEAHEIAAKLCEALDIRPGDHVKGAYMDLILGAANRTSSDAKEKWSVMVQHEIQCELLAGEKEVNVVDPVLMQIMDRGGVLEKQEATRKPPMEEVD